MDTNKEISLSINSTLVLVPDFSAFLKFPSTASNESMVSVSDGVAKARSLIFSHSPQSHTTFADLNTESRSQDSRSQSPGFNCAAAC